MINPKLKIISWNINSIKVRFSQLQVLIEQENPDIILLQELRAANMQTLPNYISYFYCLGGRNGVAVLCKNNIKCLPLSTNITDRIIGIYLPQFNIDIYSVYVPNGFSNFSPVEHKIQFLNMLGQLKPTQHDTQLIIGGDFNILYKETHHTLRNPFGEDEINVFKSLHDIYFNPSHCWTDKYITWWAYFNDYLGQNKGFGLDTFLTKNLNKDCQKLSILKNYRYLHKPSDHAPIQLLVY